MAYDLLGKNFTPPDVHAKVTGKAKYAEDFRVDGMVFCKLLSSPMPHARVHEHRRERGARDARRARHAHGRRRAERPPAPARADPHQRAAVRRPSDPRGRGRRPKTLAQRRARADQDRRTRSCRSRSIRCRACSPAARMRAATATSRQSAGVDLRSTSNGRRRISRAARRRPAADGRGRREWSYGDVDAGFAAAKLVLDETFVTAGMSHHSMEPRTRDGVLAERQVLRATARRRARASPCRASRALIGIEPRGARLHRRVLRRRLRLEGRRVSADGDAGAACRRRSAGP